MTDDYLERARRLFKQHGIESFRVEHRSKHRAIVVSHDGKEHTIIIPSTGSDWRGPTAMVADLRRLLGLRRARSTGETCERKSSKPKRRVRSRDRIAVSSPLLDEPVCMPDKFYGPLNRLRMQFAAEAERPVVAEIPRQKPSASVTRLRTPWLGQRVRYLAS